MLTAPYDAVMTIDVSRYVTFCYISEDDRLNYDPKLLYTVIKAAYRMLVSFLMPDICSYCNTALAW